MSVIVGTGPDLVIAGSARSGTTMLAAQLARHPQVDAGAVKESNYFSRNFDRGAAWYDDLYAPRHPGRLRLDASVSYTYPQYPQALPRLAEAAPEALVVYVTRDPVARAVSHYLFDRHYFEHEAAEDFGKALARRPFYTDIGDYGRWIDALLDVYPAQQVLVVPFDALTTDAGVARVVCAQMGLTAPPEDDRGVRAHQNQVVTFRSPSMRRLTSHLKHSRAYPTVRRVLGPDTMRHIRAALTTTPQMPTMDEALATCDQAQRRELDALRTRAGAAVSDLLRAQDERLGLDWLPYWAPDGAPYGE